MEPQMYFIVLVVLKVEGRVLYLPLSLSYILAPWDCCIRWKRNFEGRMKSRILRWGDDPRLPEWACGENRI